MPIRVVAVEDDPRYRASLETLFAHAPDFELVQTYGSGEAAFSDLVVWTGREQRPPWDLVLMDLELPGMSGVSCTRALKERVPDLAVVVVTVFEDSRVVLEAICAGADGYLTKRTGPSEVVEELKIVVGGGAPLSAGVARTVLGLLRDQERPASARAPEPRLDLTDRERAVLRCLVQGRSYKRTAAELDISIDTVRSHVRRVYSKLQVHSVAQAVGRALREGIV